MKLLDCKFSSWKAETMFKLHFEKQWSSLCRNTNWIHFYFKDARVFLYTLIIDITTRKKPHCNSFQRERVRHFSTCDSPRKKNWLQCPTYWFVTNSMRYGEEQNSRTNTCTHTYSHTHLMRVTYLSPTKHTKVHTQTYIHFQI